MTWFNPVTFASNTQDQIAPASVSDIGDVDVVVTDIDVEPAACAPETQTTVTAAAAANPPVRQEESAELAKSSDVAETPVSTQTDSPQEPDSSQRVAQEILQAPAVRSRVLTAMGISAVLAVGALLAWPTEGRSFGASPPSPADTTAVMAAAQPTPQQLASDDQVRAVNAIASTGSLDGFRPSPGGQTVFGYSQDTVVFGRDVGGTCWVYAVVSGEPTQIQQDASGYGCTPAAIDEFAQRMRELSS